MYKQTIILTNNNEDHIKFDHVLISSDNNFLVTWGNRTITIRDPVWGSPYDIIKGKIKIFNLTTSEKPTETEFNQTIPSGIADVKLSPDNKYLVVITLGEVDRHNGIPNMVNAALIYDLKKITSAEPFVEVSGGRRQSRRHRRQSRRRQTRKR